MCCLLHEEEVAFIEDFIFANAANVIKSAHIYKSRKSHAHQYFVLRII